ncbi:MAG: pyruvate kinase, partial [Bacteroidales bacterium]|nr:pyruvate kinase [Bacteroidales bacterium]
KEAEKTKMSENDIPIEISTNDLTSFLCNAAVETSSKLGTQAILTDTYSGRTARFLAAHRGRIPVLAICYHERSTRQLSLSYGVIPIFQESKGNTQQYFIEAIQHLLKMGWVEKDSMICYLSGSFGEGYGTTFLEVNQIEKILSSREKYLLPNFE